MTTTMPVEHSPEMAAAVEAFAAQWTGTLSDPATARDVCFTVSELFVACLTAYGVADAEVVCGLRMDGTLVLGGHAAVRVGDDVYDWTYRQFDPDSPVPRVTTMTEFRQEWI